VALVLLTTGIVQVFARRLEQVDRHRHAGGLHDPLAEVDPAQAVEFRNTHPAHSLVPFCRPALRGAEKGIDKRHANGVDEFAREAGRTVLPAFVEET
jgi:hypothetical protein